MIWFGDLTTRIHDLIVQRENTPDDQAKQRIRLSRCDVLANINVIVFGPHGEQNLGRRGTEVERAAFFMQKLWQTAQKLWELGTN